MKRLAALLFLASPLAAQRPDPLAAEIDRRAKAIQAQVTEWRHDIHRNPELSFQEVRTAAKVAEHLRKLGLEVRTGVGGNGVVGVLRGARPGPVVALRADMDALPIREENTCAHASKHDGVMHACGHDGHMANLYGAALVLATLKDRVRGRVKLIFQPAEEGGAGANVMCDDGALKSPDVDVIFGLHGWSELPCGEVYVRTAPRRRQAGMVSLAMDRMLVG